MHAQEIRRALEAAPRSMLTELSGLVWRAFAAGEISENDANDLSHEIEARKAVPVIMPTPPSRRWVGSRPRSDASMARRRRWAASGYMPPQLAAHFTVAEAACLAVLALHVMKGGSCTLAVGHIAGLAGVSESTVKRAIRVAKLIGLISVEERRVHGWRSMTNRVRIISAEWSSWLSRRSARPPGGVQAGTPTNTRDQDPGTRSPRKRQKATEPVARPRQRLDQERRGRSRPQQQCQGAPALRS